MRGVIREALCGRVARAPFDERLSVTGLILSRLTEGFKKLWDKNASMELLMEQLKRYRQEMDGGAKTSANSAAAQTQSPATALSRLASGAGEGAFSQEEKRTVRKAGGPPVAQRANHAGGICPADEKGSR